jgi:hypothetical protein
MKTLTREEIHANEYGGIEDLRANVASFVDQYYKQAKAALGIGIPDTGAV